VPIKKAAFAMVSAFSQTIKNRRRAKKFTTPDFSEQLRWLHISFLFAQKNFKGHHP